VRQLSSLSNRIFLASALLAVLSIGAALFLVNLAVTRRAEAELERSLEEAGELVAQFQSLFFEQLVIQSRLIADLPRLKAAVYEQNAPTVLPVAREYSQQIGADLFIITNRLGQPLAVVGEPGDVLAGLAEQRAVRAALAGGAGVDLWSSHDGLLQVVSVPIAIGPGQPEILGTLTAGLSLSRRLADRIKALTRSDVIFVDRGRVQASTLPALAGRPLAGLLDTADRVSRLPIGGEEYEVVRRPLVRPLLDPAPAGLPVADAAPGDGPSVIVLRSSTAHFAFLRTLRTALAATAILAVLVATVVSYAVARTVTRPIRALTATMREMAATGNLAMPAPSAPTVWDDEDARVLTGTFHMLTGAIERFQREAAQRERLSSLGRLSTVLAHEVRNPLMIIKASLRTLRRGTAGDGAPATAAIADIEGEVRRLDLLVHDVLDYARPIAFTRAAVDLGRLVRDAAQAVMASQSGPAVAVAVPDGLAVTTDPERLRQALVNILTNACDAVVERERLTGPAGSPAAQTGPPGAAPVQVGAAVLADGRIELTVCDRGVGMSPEQAARIFEPFFTTKRTGSGIGLAITRNIVEGLGGTIAVESAAGRGTTMRLTIPRGGV
jgi:signal transduction histidine kinase